MNQLDPQLGRALAQQTSLEEARRLLSADMTTWHSDDFALAITLCRQTAALGSGFGSGTLRFGLAAQMLRPESFQPVAHIELETEQGVCLLHLDGAALNTLAGLLLPGGDDLTAHPGAALSLDAIEALICGVLSPAPALAVGRADWEDGQSLEARDALAALQMGSAAMPMSGLPEALEGLHAALLVGSTAAESPDLFTSTSVLVERLLGLARISMEERARLEPGGGITLDAIWPQGRICAGRSFWKEDTEWHDAPQLGEADILVLRRGSGVQRLDDPALGTLPASNTILLLDGEQPLASGRLVHGWVDGSPSLLFRIDALLRP